MDRYWIGLVMTKADINSYKPQKVNAHEVSILEALLKESGFVSGNELAKMIGLSRTSVHSKIEQLKQSSFKIEASPKKGYRLKEEPKAMNAHLLAIYQKELPENFTINYYPCLDSTNEEAERQFYQKLQPPFAIISSKQTKGRGRLGRQWQSQKSTNLYCSILFAPNIAPEKLQKFTLWAGLEVCKALQKYISDSDLKIKWPNDLYYRERKLSGMLTEAKIDTDRMHTIVFGIGINVNSSAKTMPQSIQSIATSLKEITGGTISLNQIAIAVIAAVIRAYSICMNPEESTKLPIQWQDYDYLKNKRVELMQNHKTIKGTVLGINDDGALLLKTDADVIKTIHSGDVTLKK